MKFLDYEVEIGIVIGQTIEVGSVITQDNLADYITAWVVTNDVSARDVQLTKPNSTKPNRIQRSHRLARHWY